MAEPRSLPDPFPFQLLEEGDAPTKATASEGDLRVYPFMVGGITLVACLVLALWGTWYALEGPQPQPSYSSPFGWAAAGCAAVAFSFTEVPVKAPGSQEVGPVLFNAYGCFGATLVNSFSFLTLLLLGLPFEFQVHGCLAAIDLVLVQYFARQAVWLVGIGVGPAIWCAVGILTSFLWGTVVFGDRPWNLSVGLVGLSLLLFGVPLLSFAIYLSKRSEAPTEPGTRSPVCAALLGLGLAVLTGVCDGSLVTFFMQVESSGAAGRSLAAMLQYLGSFGLTLLGLHTVVVTVYMTVGRGRKLALKDLRLRQCGVPGALSGVFWALANACGILAAHYLGMALAFPLTQTALVLGGLYALVVFRELKTWASAAVFSVAIVLAVAGAILLALFGRPTKPWP